MVTIKIQFSDMPDEFSPENNCYRNALNKKYRTVLSDEPDFLFYGALGTSFLKYRNCVRIFLATEPVSPNFNDCDYAIGFEPICFNDRYFRQLALPDFSGSFRPSLLQNRDEVINGMAERKFCNFIYSNDHRGIGAGLRKEFCKKLMEYRGVDCPGRVLNNMPGGIGERYSRTKSLGLEIQGEGWSKKKLDFMMDYKFSVAFENAAIVGWTTEKILHPFAAYSIPIYWGNPAVAAEYNPAAFINCNDFGNNFDAVINRIRELDQDQDQYLAMLREPPLQPNYPFNWWDSMSEYLSSIIEKGNSPLPKNPLSFTAVSAESYAVACQKGSIGMRRLLKDTTENFLGWITYKMHS